MRRRRFLATSGVVALGSLGGCASGGEFDPDVDPTWRLGTAPSVSMSVTATEAPGVGPDETFAGEATERAAEEAAGRLHSILAEEGHSGRGIRVSVAAVDLADLDQPADAEPPGADEFRRGKAIAPLVFHFHHYSRDGELLAEPSIPFGAVVETTPRTFEVAVSYPERSYDAVLPGVCRRGWIQNT